MEEIELTQGRWPTKSLQRVSRQICEKQQIREFGRRIENVPDLKDINTDLSIFYTLKGGQYETTKCLF